MTSTDSLLLPPSQRSFTLCAIFSLAFHAGLLAGLGLISKPTIESESVPVVTVQLMPLGSETPAESPESPEPTAQPQLSMRSTPRSLAMPSPSVSASSQLSMHRPVTITSSINPLTTHNTPEPLPVPERKRVLKDHQAANALIGQTLMKMTRSSMSRSPTLPMNQTSVSQLTSSKTRVPRSALITQSASSRQTATSRPSPSKKKILMARPPGDGEISGSKVGIIRSIPPVYPRVARESGWEGTVIIRVLVRTSGIPGKVQVQKSSGHSILDEAAADAVRKWRFKPEKNGNIPIQKYVDIPLKFDLRG